MDDACQQEFVTCSFKIHKKIANFTKFLKLIKIRKNSSNGRGLLLASYNSKLNVGEVCNFRCVIKF